MPIVNRLAREYTSIDFVYIDVDNMSDRDIDIVQQINTNAIPTYGFFDRRGRLVDQMIGWNEQEFRRRLDDLVRG